MEKNDNFKSWELTWEPNHVQRFWDWQGRNPAKSRLYFSRLLGDSVLDEVSHYLRLKGTIVDYGSGPGFLVEKLLKRNLDTLAVDSSAESVNLLRERFVGKAHFLGAEVISAGNLPIQDEFTNVVFLIETVEHLDDKTLAEVMLNIYRILKPGGSIVVTVPHGENLAENQIMCPNCGCVFHVVQHVRSLSPMSLGKIMKSAGFSEIVCKPTIFSLHHPLLRPLQRFKYFLKRESFPHLLYIGKK